MDDRNDVIIATDELPCTCSKQLRHEKDEHDESGCLVLYCNCLRYEPDDCWEQKWGEFFWTPLDQT